MLHYESQLNVGEALPFQPHCVQAGVRLSELSSRNDLQHHPFLFVIDEQGNPLGVLSTRELSGRIASENPVERRQWLSMPVEALLDNRLESLSNRSCGLSADARAAGLPSQCTAVSEDGRLLALVTDDDLLISWRSIAQTLRLSQSDTVTGLPNRTAFEQHLRAECNRCERCGDSVAVILIDLDHFKAINDRCGHAAGDFALRAVGKVLRRTLRSYDMVARYGGDEFSAVCCGFRPGEIEPAMRKLQDTLRNLQNDSPPELPIPTLSIGACVVHHFSPVDGPEEIVEHADECLYVAKRSGRDCSFTTEIGAELLNTLPLRDSSLQTGGNYR
ncbi:MAG: GGDEF domain-containing protein [Planctomycetaceae bacterium]